MGYDLSVRATSMLIEFLNPEKQRKPRKQTQPARKPSAMLYSPPKKPPNPLSLRANRTNRSRSPVDWISPSSTISLRLVKELLSTPPVSITR